MNSTPVSETLEKYGLIKISTEFESAAQDHRLRVRSAIRAAILKEDPSTAAELLSAIEDLSKPPRLDGWAISISHCPALGGFVLKRSSRALGLDFEIAERVSLKTAERVAAFSGEKKIIAELQRCEIPLAAFWAAKESAIKAFGNRDPDLNPHFGIVEILDFNFENLQFTASYDGVQAHGTVFVVSNESATTSTTAARDARIVGAIAELEY